MTAILNLQNFDFFFVKRSIIGMEIRISKRKKIRSKSVNSRLKSIDKAIFKMAAVRHLEFAKIAVLVT